jgi:hypothetical protein
MGLEKSDADCRGDVAAGGAEEGRRISGTGLPPDAAEIPAWVSNFEQVAAG